MQAPEAWTLWLTAGTLIVALATLLFGIAQWRISRRQESRDITRGVADWQVEALSPSTFVLTNLGPDDALDVTIEMWSEAELESAARDRLTKGQSVKFRLPHRERTGPAPVLLPPMTMQEVPAEPPAVAVQMGFEVQLQQWKEKRRLYEIVESQREELRKNLEAQQVSYRIIWRAENGKWDHQSGLTG